MNNLNSVLIEGNLTRDPESYTTPGGSSLCKFSIASNRYYKKGDEYQQEVSFFTIECWADLAVTCVTYLQKGRAVRVIGRLKQERWESSEGQPRERVVITAEHVEFGTKYRKQDKKEGSEAAAEKPGDQSKAASSEAAEHRKSRTPKTEAVKA